MEEGARQEPRHCWAGNLSQDSSLGLHHGWHPLPWPTLKPIPLDLAPSWGHQALTPPTSYSDWTSLTTGLMTRANNRTAADTTVCLGLMIAEATSYNTCRNQLAHKLFDLGPPSDVGTIPHFDQCDQQSMHSSCRVFQQNVRVFLLSSSHPFPRVPSSENSFPTQFNTKHKVFIVSWHKSSINTLATLTLRYTGTSQTDLL